MPNASAFSSLYAFYFLTECYYWPAPNTVASGNSGCTFSVSRAHSLYPEHLLCSRAPTTSTAWPPEAVSRIHLLPTSPGLDF